MQIKGWTGILIAIVIIGMFVLKVWVKVTPHSFGEGTWEIEPGKAISQDLRASRHVKFKADIEPQGPREPYDFVILDDANAAKLADPAADRAAITKVFETHGDSALHLQQLDLDPGTYHLIAGNPGKNKVTLKYTFYEETN